MIRSRFTWALALVLCAGLMACGKSGGGTDPGTGGTGGDGGTGGSGGIDNPVCGNGAEEAGEECDDGNLTPGDGCDATCQDEEIVEGACTNAVDYRGNATLDDGVRLLVGEIEADSNAMLVGSCGGDGQETVFSFMTDRKGILMWQLAKADLSGLASGFATYAMTSCDVAAELACTVDGAVGQVTVNEPGEVFIVVDALAEVDDTVDFNLITLWVPLKELGDRCDPTGEADACVEGLVCKGDPATCQEGAPPVIARAAMYFGEDPSYLIADGTDEEGDVVGFYLEAVDADGEPMVLFDFDGNGTPEESKVYIDNEALMGATWGMMGFFPNDDGTWFAMVPTYFSAFGVEIIDPAEPVAGIRLTLVDAAALESNTLTAYPPVEAGLGEACDNDGFVNCGTGMLCKGSPLKCENGTAPVIDRAVYGVRPDGVQALVFSGTDVDGDLEVVRFEMLDADGNNLPFDYDGDGADDVSMDIGVDTAGETSFLRSFTVPEELIAPKIALTPVDRIALEGARVVVDNTPIPVIALGEACSPEGWNSCEAGIFCDGTTNPVCTDLRAAVCEAAPEIDAAAAGNYSATGTTKNPSMWDPPVGCWDPQYGDPLALPEGIVVLHLPNGATSLTLSTNNAETQAGIGYGDTILYLLPTSCGNGTALGCNDDVDLAGQIYSSTLELANVAAGDYTVVVDTWNPADVNKAFKLDVVVVQ